MDEPAAAPERASKRSGRIVLGLIVVSWLGVMIAMSPSVGKPLQCGRDVAVNDDTLVMLSASWCSYCRRARAYLQSEQIAHCEYDVETNDEGRRQFAQLKVKVIPVIKIRDEVLFGFNRAAIHDALVGYGLADFDD